MAARGRGSGRQQRKSAYDFFQKAKKSEVVDGVDDIGLSTDLIKLKDQMISYSSKECPMMMSVFRDGEYIVEDMPTKKKLKEQLFAMRSGDIGNATGFEHAVLRSKTGRLDFNDETSLDDPLEEGETGSADGQAANRDIQDGDEEFTPKLLAKLFETRMVNWDQDVTRMKKEMRKCYVFMWGKCYPGLKSALRSHEQFPHIENSEDVLLLFTLMKIVIGGGGFMHTRDRKEKVRLEFEELRKLPHEHLDRFKERFEMSADKLTSVNIAYSEEELADAFMRKLDPYFDNVKKTQLRTGRHPGALHVGDRFATIEEAFAGAQAEIAAQRTLSGSQHKSNSERENRTGAAFTGRGKSTGRGSGRNSGGRGRSGRSSGGRGGGRGHGSSSDETGSSEKSELTNITCHFCGGKGHKQADCTSSETSEVQCYGCQGVGHYKSNCPSIEAEA